MKTTLALLALTFSLNSFASGGFFCDAKITTIMDQTDVQISGTTGRVAGNPLISDISVSIDGDNSTISKKQVVGYWGEGPTLQLHTVDSNAEYSEIILNYNQETNSGELVIDYQGVIGKTYDVECSFE